MTHFIRRLCSALLLVTCFSYSNAQTVGELDPNQTYSTGNIVVPTTSESGSTWTGAVYQDSLTCWGWGDPGYCGPNAIVRPGGSINFSYGSVYVYQEQLLSSLIPGGTGLQIRGYDFSFMAKNGNGWDDGGTDQLTALVRLWDTTNSKGSANLIYGTSWNLSYQYNWTNFTFSETFSTPYDADTIGRVQYGFIGRDNNGWAGPYGPEIYNVSFNIRYGVDPCAVNILSSPSCPGYLEYIAGLSSTPTVDTAMANQPTAATDSVTATPAVQQTAAASEQSGSSATAESQSSGGSGASLSTILNILGREQARIATVERSTVESAVEQSVREADRATEQAEAIAAATVTDSIDASVASAQNQMVLDQQQATQSSGGGLNVFSASGLSISLPDSGMGFKTPETAIESMETTAATENLPEIEISVSVPYAPIAIREETLAGNVEEKSDSAVSFSGYSAVKVVREEPTSSSDNTQNAESTETVKQNVANNDLAGDISLASLGAVPRGFDAYSATMPDGSFYAPREIYRGQRNVDNARALRGLGTDRLHREMVDQQYNQGAR